MNRRRRRRRRGGDVERGDRAASDGVACGGSEREGNGGGYGHGSALLSLRLPRPSQSDNGGACKTFIPKQSNGLGWTLAQGTISYFFIIK